jgi:hypothetical protein
METRETYTAGEPVASHRDAIRAQIQLLRLRHEARMQQYAVGIPEEAVDLAELLQIVEDLLDEQDEHE